MKIAFYIIIFAVVLFLVKKFVFIDKFKMNEEITKLDIKNKKSLVVYFSHSGNTKVIAEYIKDEVNSDIHRVLTEYKYSNNYQTCLMESRKDNKENARPKLVEDFKNIKDYDVIFIGYPIWWGTMPMAMFTFLESKDLKDKVIIPFCTHEGSGLGKSESDIKNLCPDSKIINGLEIRGKEVKNVKEDIINWIKKINFMENKN
jgi:flavodoxin